MFRRSIFIALLFFCSTAVSYAAVPVPNMTSPLEQAETVVFHPSFSWEFIALNDSTVYIQIATDAEFKTIVDEDRIHSVVNWYVPAKRLPARTYWWRLQLETDAGEKGDWSGTRCFSVVEPEETFVISPLTSLDEMREIAVKAEKARSACIRFEKGTYRFKPGFEETVFKWSEAENISLDGGGSRFIMEEPSAQLWSAEKCRNIQIGNFSYEYDPRPHTVATVLSTDPQEGVMDVEIVDGFAEARFPRKVNQFFCYALDPQDNRRLHPSRPGHIFLDPEKTADLGSRRLRYAVRDRVEFGLLREMKPGDRIVAVYRRWPLSYVKRCTDFTLFNISNSRAESSLFMGGGNEDMKFLNLTAESENKLYPTPAGCVTGNDRHGPWIEGCSWEALADDGPNITGNLYLINKMISRDTLLLQTGPIWQNAVWQKGDRLVFWNPANGLPVKTVTIAEVLTSAEELRKGLQKVHVSEVILGARPGLDMLSNTHVYNLSCQNNGFVARNNRLVGGRRFGFNVKANNALIEKNYFEALASSAVYIENEPIGWEGLCSSGVVVQDNVMNRCGDSVDSARRRRASGVHVNLWRVPGPDGEETSWQGHSNILIRRNTIIDWESVGIGADNAQDIRIEGNQLSSSNKSGFFMDKNFGIFAGRNTRDVRVGDNCFNDERAFDQIRRD